MDRKKHFLWLKVILCIVLIQASLFSLTAEKIRKRMIEALGGEKTLTKINDITLSGNIELIPYGFSGPITIYQKEPDKLRIDAEIMERIYTQAYDGKTAWATNFESGISEEMPEKMAQSIKRDALGVDATLHPEKYGITFTFKGKEKIEEKEYLLLEQKYGDGYSIVLYVDPLTYLTYKIVATAFNDLGEEVEAETYYSDYRKKEGVAISFSQTVYQNNELYMKITIEEVSVNRGLPDSFFSMD